MMFLAIYANLTEIASRQEQALLDYVAGGKGFIPLHCASYCFLNSPKYIALVGGQFQRHGTGVFRDTVAEPDHPVMKGFGGFESWDETYVHHQHNEKDRTVLEYRVEARAAASRGPGSARTARAASSTPPGDTTSGPGAIPAFRTWSSAASAGRSAATRHVGAGAASTDTAAIPRMTPLAKDVKPFEYVEAKIPFYPPSGERKGRRLANQQMQMPVSPAESLKHMVTPAGLSRPSCSPPSRRSASRSA